MRRLPLLLLLAILPPVPAQADRHTMECFTGLTPEKEQALSLRISCGIRVESTPYDTTDPIQGRTAPGGATAFSATTVTGLDPDPDSGTKTTRKGKRSLFAVAEVAEYVAGRDSGGELDGWMIGLRYLFFGQKPVEPFFHLMGGRQRPSRSNAMAEDAVTGWAGTIALGGGVDIEINPSLHSGIVPVIRLQLDAVKPEAIDVYGRFTFGVSLRYEGPHK